MPSGERGFFKIQGMDQISTITSFSASRTNNPFTSHVFFAPAACGEQEKGAQRCLRLSDLHVSATHRISRATFLRHCRRAQGREISVRVLDKTWRRYVAINCPVGLSWSARDKMHWVIVGQQPGLLVVLAPRPAVIGSNDKHGVADACGRGGWGEHLRVADVGARFSLV